MTMMKLIIINIKKSNLKYIIIFLFFFFNYFFLLHSIKIILLFYYYYDDDEMMTSSVSLIVDIEDNLCERHFEKFILTMNATVGNKMIAGAATPFVKEASIALLFFSIWCFETFTENVLKTSPLLVPRRGLCWTSSSGRALPERFCIYGQDRCYASGTRIFFRGEN